MKVKNTFAVYHVWRYKEWKFCLLSSLLFLHFQLRFFIKNPFKARFKVSYTVSETLYIFHITLNNLIS